MTAPFGEDISGGWFGQAVRKGQEKCDCQDRAVCCADLGVKSKNTKAAVGTSLGHLPSRMALFAVYDGHAGSGCSEFLEQHSIRQFWQSAGEIAKTSHLTEDQFLKNTLQHMCQKLEEAFIAAFHMAGRRDGSCGIIAILWGNKIAVANVGDCRAVASDGGRAVDLSRDHKPNDPEEHARITKAGGSVSLDPTSGEPRLSVGHLAVSRAFGDNSVKQSWPNILIATPEIRIIDASHMQFCVLASDGVWCRASSVDAIRIVGTELSKGSDPLEASKALIAEALNRKSNDDIAVIVISLQ
eukprot:c7531_g1_i1.p1 GENE.c7531_g1_i1~~c7531_g1_i1.p1  ORF type:complete len:298 (+),score=74.83 c7531_g1_i1:51-944(+)